MPNYCMICGSKSLGEISEGLICDSCKGNPFKVEKLRQKLAEKSDLINLKKTYSQDFASLKDINSADMWNFYVEYHKSVEEENKTTQKRIRETIKLFPSTASNVLDIGVGYGFVIEELHKKFPHLSLAGIDISSKAIQNIKQKLDGDFRVGSAENLPWPDNSFDVVLLLEILEHIPATNLFGVLNEVRRVLKNSGVLIVSVPLYENLEAYTFKCPVCNSLINPNGHVRSYTPKLVLSELKLAGFLIKKVKKIWPASRTAYFSPLLSRLFPSRFKPANLLIQCKKKSNKKVLMFAPFFYPHIGGVERHVQRLSEELIKKKHKVTIVTVKHDQNLPEFEQLNKIKIYRFPKKRLLNIWFWVFRHRNLIKNADIIHCHDSHTFIFWYLPFRFLYPLKPVYITFHGHEGSLPIPRTKKIMRKIAERLTNGNICVGGFIAKWYGTKPNFVVYGGVDEPKHTGNIMNSKISAVFIGRLERDTGILTYISAVKILKRKYNINLEVDVCGDGSLREIIEKIIRENKLNIRLHGFVENPIDYLIKGKFAFVSGYLAILEAMINKRLVFSVFENELKKDYLTLIPNSKDMMIIVSSPKELAEKIVYYYKNPKKAEEKIKNAYRFAKEQTWEKVANTYLKLWGVEK